MVAQSDHPWQGGPHVVMLQTLNHYMVYRPIKKKASA